MSTLYRYHYPPASPWPRDQVLSSSDPTAWVRAAAAGDSSPAAGKSETLKVFAFAVVCSGLFVCLQWWNVNKAVDAQIAPDVPVAEICCERD